MRFTASQARELVHWRVTLEETKGGENAVEIMYRLENPVPPNIFDFMMSHLD